MKNIRCSLSFFRLFCFVHYTINFLKKQGFLLVFSLRFAFERFFPLYNVFSRVYRAPNYLTKIRKMPIIKGIIKVYEKKYEENAYAF